MISTMLTIKDNGIFFNQTALYYSPLSKFSLIKVWKWSDFANSKADFLNFCALLEERFCNNALILVMVINLYAGDKNGDG